MTFHQSLNDEYAKLQRLKANVHTRVLSAYVAKMKTDWKPKSKIFTGHHRHGRKSAEEENVELFYDEYHHERTTEDIAFKGYLFKRISDLLNSNKI